MGSYDCDVSENPVTSPDPQVHEIPAQNLDAFKTAFGKIQKRAVKLGVPVPTFEVLGVEDRKLETGPTGFEINIRYQVALVTVAGEAPKFDGWSPLAVIDLDPDDAPDGPHVVHVIAGDADPAWRSETDRCDHCTQTPRGRKKLVVVEHDDGTRKVVGTTCVADFLGGVAPERIASWFDILASLDDLAGAFEDSEEFRGARAEWRYDPSEFLAFTVSAIALDGWVSRGDARNGISREATADQVVGILIALQRGTQRDKADAMVYYPTEAQTAEADAALEWARDCWAGNDSLDGGDYLMNVQAVASKAGWRFKDVGLGASIAVAYARQLEREVARAKQAEDLAGSVWVGEPGDKLTFEADVLAVRPYSGDYGEIDIIKLLTSDGNVIVWWASNAWLDIPAGDEGDSPRVGQRRVEPGDHVFGKGSVKRVGDYNGVQETTITRAKLSLTPLPAPKARKTKKTGA